MPNLKLYSYRYPYDVQTAWEPLRNTLDKGFGNDYEQVLRILHDRDRAIEDWLNTISQGRLAYQTTTSAVSRTTAGQTDLGLSVTVVVPANRVLRVTGQSIIVTTNNGAGSTPPIANGLIFADGVSTGYFAHIQETILGLGSTISLELIQANSIIVTPTAGEHTYKLVAEYAGTAGGTIALGGVAASPAFILVEDIGPASVS